MKPCTIGDVTKVVKAYLTYAVDDQGEPDVFSGRILEDPDECPFSSARSTAVCLMIGKK
jgi:hypothetical protein